LSYGLSKPLVPFTFQEFSGHKKTFPTWEGFQNRAILPHLLNCQGENDSNGDSEENGLKKSGLRAWG
jgi:hypothetical protein